MMKKKAALQKLREFNPRGSRCPICNKDFRKGCDHSVQEAKDRLFENYIKAIQQDGAIEENFEKG